MIFFIQFLTFNNIAQQLVAPSIGVKLSQCLVDYIYYVSCLVFLAVKCFAFNITCVKVFHEVAYKAKTRKDLLSGIDEFLDQVTVLPPGEWDSNIRIEPPKELPGNQVIIACSCSFITRIFDEVLVIFCRN